jgi:long-chain acyl-CoA synthetase
VEKLWMQHRPGGVPESLEYLEIPIYNILSRAAKRLPDRVLSIYNDRKITYGEYEKLANRLASALIDLCEEGR